MTNQQILALETVKALLKKNGSTTTLEVKDTLREVFPDYKWYQNEISEFMDELFENQTILDLTYSDNGTYRTYYVEPIIVKPKTTDKVSKSKAVELIKNSGGTFFTAVFIKKNGDERVINGQIKKDNFMDDMGYIRVRESNGKKRRINPRTLLSVSIKGTKYIVK